MISVCIPVYNIDVTLLVNELSNQIKTLKAPCEIVIIDDCSDSYYKEVNKGVCDDFLYMELPENIGRAKIRNLFLKYAQYNYLLFLDCDSLIGSSDFLSRYVDVIEDKPNVVCGGRVYESHRPERAQLLRWKYGVIKESQPYHVRRKAPNNSFMTNNFVVDRKILEEIRFDERITQYGHEDTLFGFMLKKQDIEITHIDNPVINGDLETNIEYLSKTKKGIINLINILNYLDYNKDLIDDITLLRIYNKIKRVEKLFLLSFLVFKPVVYYLLLKGYFNLYMFDYYKMGILIEKLRSKKTISNSII